MTYVLVFACLMWAAASVLAVAGSFIWLSSASDFGPVGAIPTVLGAITVMGAGFVSACYAYQDMLHVAA